MKFSCAPAANSVTSGIVSALHSHTGPLDHVLERASAIDPTLTPEETKKLEDLKKAVRKAQATSKEAFTKERGAFKSLLLANPNYFGNLSDSPFKSVLPISGNTYYEELGCVGYQPQQRRLEGVVYIYQPGGYGATSAAPERPSSSVSTCPSITARPGWTRA
jgi:hypothetical protein